MASTIILSDNGVSSGSAGLKQTAGNDGVLILQTTTSGGTATTAVTIDTSQNVGIGVPNPPRKLSVSGIIGSYNTTGANDSQVLLYNSGSASVLSSTYASSGSYLPLAFYTSDTERARIDSSGNLLVGTTTAYGKLGCESSANARNIFAFSTISSGFSDAILVSEFRNYAPNNTTARFMFCGDTSSTRCEIRSNGGIANFSGNNVNLSDRREKTNFAPAKSYLETICAIPVQTFNYIDQNIEEDPGLTLGVVAQDVQDVAPELVMESNWGTTEEPKMRLSIYQTDLQYALMKCIQEQQALITTLTERINALEAK